MSGLALVSPFIDALENVLVVTDGKVTTRKVTDLFESIETASLSDISEEALNTIQTTMIKEYDGIQEALDSKDDSLFIQIPKGFKSDEKLYIFYLESGNTNRHVHVNVGPNANVNIFEYFVENSPGEKNVLVSYTLGAYAHLDVASLSAFSNESHVSFNRQGFMQERSNATMTLASFGDEHLTQNTHIKLLGFQANASLTAIALANQNQISTIKSIIEHNAIESEGVLNHYGVSNDEAFLTFEGVGKIEQGMRQSKNHQHNKGVILAPKARLDANPLLIIDEYDVEAGHGAAVGRIDEEQLYYMMSRGLDKKTSERLIVNGFLHPLDRYLTDDLFKNHVQTLLLNKTK